MQVELGQVGALRFDGGGPVRSASALAPFGDGWLVAQDDATHAAWLRPAGVVPVRVLPPVDGHEVFSSAAGTKHLKPDFEAACEVTVAGAPAVVLLGSGSTAARMRASLVRLGPTGPQFTVADLQPLYEQVGAVLGVALNLEGACRVGDRVRWFNRGNLAAGVPSGSVDVDLAGLVAALTGSGHPGEVRVGAPRRYDLGAVDGIGLAVTDAVALPDGRVLLSAAAEDTPNAVDDGPVVGTALALVDGDALLAATPLPTPGGTVHKVEGLGLLAAEAAGARLLAVVDADDPDLPSARLTLRATWA
jgi:hypothetical protein